MSQVAIYIDNQTAKALNKVSRRAGLSRSEWVSSLIRKELGRKIPDELFQTLGTWEKSEGEPRTSEEIFRKIREGTEQRARKPLR